MGQGRPDHRSTSTGAGTGEDVEVDAGVLGRRLWLACLHMAHLLLAGAARVTPGSDSFV